MAAEGSVSFLLFFSPFFNSISQDVCADFKLLASFCVSFFAVVSNTAL